MKRFALTAVVAMLPGLVLTAPGLAQQPRDRPADAPPRSDTRKADDSRKADDNRKAWENREGYIESSRLVGMKVTSAEGKRLGALDQLMVDPKSGKVTHAVIGLGGMLGVGEKRVVVPWSDVRIARTEGNQGDFVAHIDQATLDRAPRFEASAVRENQRQTPAASPATERDRDKSDRNKRDR